MENYRQAPAALPFVTTVRGHLMAVDVETGALRWQRPLVTITRIVLVGPRVFVAVSREQIVLVLDRVTGNELGTVKLDFSPESMLLIGDRLVVSGYEACLAMTLEGRVLYRIGVQIAVPSKKLFENHQRDIVGFDATGREAWRFRAAENGGQMPFLAHDDGIDRPDRP